MCLLVALLLASATAQTDFCTSTCRLASNGDCDDGGPGSEFSVCAYGTDCEDCGARTSAWPPSPWPPSPWPPGLAPSPSPPAVPTGACITDGLLLQTASSAFFILAFACFIAAVSTPVTQPKLFWLLWLLSLLSFGLGAFLASPAAHAWLLPEQCPFQFESISDISEVVIVGILVPLLLGNALKTRREKFTTFRKRIEAIEGDLPKRLNDGSLRLLRVAWLLQRPVDWVLQRRQDLPDEAFWSSADAVRLLLAGKVAALSYKWQGPFNSSKGGGDQPDGKRFHLDIILAYYRQGNRATARPALMWDFAAVPQHNPVTGEKRTQAENDVFKPGLLVMSNAYASPRVLVLQHRRIPIELEQELYKDFDGKPPADRLDLIPYAGKHCRSGWCTSESACALLMTEGGGHAYELGVGKAPVAYGRLPSVQEMEALFQHESTRFIGNADRDAVSKGYLELRAKLKAYDEECVPKWVRLADKVMTGSDKSDGQARVLLVVVTLSLPPLAILTQGGATWLQSIVYAEEVILPAAVIGYIASVLPIILIAPSLLLSSRIVRAHLAAAFGYRSRDSLEYTFHCSIRTPPFRKRTTERAVERGVEFVVPACFLPRDTEQPSLLLAERVTSRSRPAVQEV